MTNAPIIAWNLSARPNNGELWRKSVEVAGPDALWRTPSDRAAEAAALLDAEDGDRIALMWHDGDLAIFKIERVDPVVTVPPPTFLATEVKDSAV